MGRAASPGAIAEQGLEDTVGEGREKGVEAEKEQPGLEQPGLELPVLSCLRRLSHCSAGCVGCSLGWEAGKGVPIVRILG